MWHVINSTGADRKSIDYPLREHHVVARALGPAGQLAHVLGQDAGELGHPLHVRLHALGVRLGPVPHLTLLLTETLNCGGERGCVCGVFGGHFAESYAKAC